METRRIRILLYDYIRVIYFRRDGDEWRRTMVKTFNYGDKLPRIIHSMLNGSIPLSDTMTIQAVPLVNGNGVKLIIDRTF